MTRARLWRGRDLHPHGARHRSPSGRSSAPSSGLPIFVPHGVLFFFPKGEPYLDQSLAAHRALGLPSEALTNAQMARRFPMIDFAGVDAGIFEPGFGALMARRAVQTLVERFVARGRRRICAARPMPPGRSERAARHAPAWPRGATLEADRFVFALGPWLPKYFPDLLGRRIVATRQEIFYFAPPAGDRRFLPDAMPGWADFNGGDMYYGFPDLEGRGVKFAHDQHGAIVDPDTQDRRPSARRAGRDHRLPRPPLPAAPRRAADRRRGLPV